MTRARLRPPVAIAWQATDPLPRGWSAWLGRLLAGYLAGLGHRGRSVTLLVGDDALLKRLNARYRSRARPTDILSFGYLEGDSPRAPPGALIGELAVSFDRAKLQARANGWPVRTELARLLAHGCAHLAGYDHGTRAQDRAMLRIEERLLESAGFAGLYGPARRTAKKRKR